MEVTVVKMPGKPQKVDSELLVGKTYGEIAKELNITPHKSGHINVNSTTYSLDDKYIEGTKLIIYSSKIYYD